jgi:hypothetical protein
MEVKLLSITPDPEDLIETTGRTACLSANPLRRDLPVLIGSVGRSHCLASLLGVPSPDKNTSECCLMGSLGWEPNENSYSERSFWMPRGSLKLPFLGLEWVFEDRNLCARLSGFPLELDQFAEEPWSVDRRISL